MQLDESIFMALLSTVEPCWSLLREAQQHLSSQSHTPSLTFSLPEPQAGAQLGQKWPWMALGSSVTAGMGPMLPKRSTDGI